MKCNIEGYRNIKTTLQDAASSEKESTATAYPDGSSSELAAKFLENLTNSVRDPEHIQQAISSRLDAINRSFHRAFKRELGEEIVVKDVDSGAKVEVFVMDAYTNATNPDEITIVVADKNNINNVDYLTFSTNSDLGRTNASKREVSVFGIGEMLQRVKDKEQAREAYEIKGTPKADSEGFTSLDGVLGRMEESNKILNSSAPSGPRSLIGAHKVEDYEHGNIDSMKQILHKLYVLGNGKDTPEYLDYLTALFDQMHPHFFNKMTLWFKENQAEVFGQVDFGRDTILIETDPNSVNTHNMSETEAYAHEVIHTMTEWGIENGPSHIVRELGRLMDLAASKLTYKDFLPVTEENADARMIQRAKDRYKYIFGSGASLQEFVAFGTTNQVLMDKLKGIRLSEAKKENKTIFDKLLGLVTNLYNAVLGRWTFKDDNVAVFDRLHELSFKLANVDRTYLGKLETMNPVGQAIEMFTKFDKELGKRVHKVRDALLKTDPTMELIDENAGPIAEAIFMVKFLFKAMVDIRYRKAAGVWATAMGMPPEGTIREIVRGFMQREDVTKLVEGMTLLRGHSDALRNSIVSTENIRLKEMFQVPLTEEEDNAITEVLLETDLSSLLYQRGRRKKYSNEKFRRLLTDSAYVDATIKKLKQQISEELGTQHVGRANWTINQAVGLGHYVATHSTHEGQLLNAYNIVKGHTSGHRYADNAHLEHLIDELASVYSIKFIEPAAKELVSNLLSGSNMKGIKAIADSYENYKEGSKLTTFAGRRELMIKGHVYEMFDHTVEMTVAPLSQAEELKAKGFKLKHRIKDKGAATNDVELGVFLTDSWGRATRQQGIITMGSHHSRGVTLRESKRIANPRLAEDLFKRDFARVQMTTLEIHDQMTRGEFNVTKATRGLVPLLNQRGEIIDYRYVMSKKDKAEVFGKRKAATEIVPWSIASIDAQARNVDIDTKALNAIKADMAANWREGVLGEDRTEYVLLGPEVPDLKDRDLFFQLPDNIREYALDRADKVIAVRRDHMNMYFGQKHLRFSDYALIRNLPAEFKHILNVFEGWWVDLVKISKSNTLLKLPSVIAGNILSNLLYVLTTGDFNLRRVITDHKESMDELDDYLKLRTRQAHLTTEINSDRESLRRVENRAVLSDKIEKKEAELVRIKQQMVRNPAHELFEAGMYQSHIIDVAGSVLEDTNRITDWGNKWLQKAPQPAQHAFNYLYLTHKTAPFKIMQELMQRSDMVSRMVVNKRMEREVERMVQGHIELPEWWLNTKGDNYPKTKRLSREEEAQFREMARTARLQSVLDEFVNYAIPNGKVEEHLNRIGVLQFTKYLKRIQRVIVESSMTNPAKTALLLAFTSLVWDASHIHDSSAMLRAVYGDHALFGIVPVYSPWHNIENVFTPPLFNKELMGRFM
jgi:ribosomal protein L7Ae-like RNA K-turn-binding protein